MKRVLAGFVVGFICGAVVVAANEVAEGAATLLLSYAFGVW